MKAALTVPGKPFFFFVRQLLAMVLTRLPSSFMRVNSQSFSSPEVVSSSIYRLKAASDSFVRNREKGTPVRDSFFAPSRPDIQALASTTIPSGSKTTNPTGASSKSLCQPPSFSCSAFSALEIPYVRTDTSVGGDSSRDTSFRPDAPERITSGPFSSCFIGPPSLKKPALSVLSNTPNVTPEKTR